MAHRVPDVRTKIPVEIWRNVVAYIQAYVEYEQSPIWPPKQTLDPTWYPYALCEADPLFEGVLSTFPLAWTKVVLVYLDDPGSRRPAEKLKDYLGWSKGRDIGKVCITRRNWGQLRKNPQKIQLTEGEVQEEQDNMRQILEVLWNDLPRCCELKICTASGDSLPSIQDFAMLDVIYPRLSTLCLDSLTRGTGYPLVTRPAIECNTKTIQALPAVESLTLTGPNVVSLVRSSAWTTWFTTLLKARGSECPRRFERLRFTHFQPQDGLPRPGSADVPFTVHDLFYWLLKGANVFAELHGIQVDEVDAERVAKIDTGVCVLELERLSGPALVAFCRCIYANVWFDQETCERMDLSIDDCDFGSISDWVEHDIGIPPLDARGIQVTNISDPAELKTFLTAARRVTNIHLLDCDGLDDEVIRYLLPSGPSDDSSSEGGGENEESEDGDESRGEEEFEFEEGVEEDEGAEESEDEDEGEGEDIPAPRLKRLTIINCPGVSWGSLRDLVQRRCPCSPTNEELDYGNDSNAFNEELLDHSSDSDSDYDNEPEVARIREISTDMPISLEEKIWFNRRGVAIRI